MKKFIVAFALLIGIASFNNPVEAQNINISINIGRQPAWGPVGYDYAGYYYFPDIDCYYDVNMSLFYYFDRGRWISAHYLPYAYRNYDLYRLYKVVLNTRDPWRYHHNHYRTYAHYRGHRNQVIIRDSRDHRYHDSRRNKVAWYSKDKSQRNYKYDYKNYKYNDRRDNNRPAQNHNYGNNNSNRNKNNDKKYDNNRRDNNNRPNYGSNSSDRNKNNDKKYDNKRQEKSRESSRPTVRSDKKDNKTSRSSSSNSGYRLASTERSGRR